MSARSFSPALKLALILSVLIHLGLAAYFLITRGVLHETAKKGVIAVDFIQSVEHQKPAAPKAENGGKVTQQTSPNPTPPEATPRQPVGDPAAAALQSNAYIQTITKLIGDRKIYPRSAIEREEEGRVVIGVSLNREGHVLSASIEEASPFDSLNKAALDTIHRVGQFPPLPDLVADPLHLHVPLVFKVESR